MFIYIPGVWEIGCCHVMSSTDINIVKILKDICDSITTDKTTKFEKCRQDIFKNCAINITDLITEKKVGDILHHKHVIDEIQSLNGSMCFKYHYGVTLTSLGVTHRLKDNDNKTSKTRVLFLRISN